MKSLGIYVHIPFCKSRCYYCDFVSSTKDKSCLNSYFDNLKKELEIDTKDNYFNNYLVETIYFGGGTPSLADPDQISTIMSLIKEKFKCDLKEITIEVNPSSTNREKLIKYKEAGINRVSIGIQSLSNKTLKAIGRIHDKDMAIRDVEAATSLGLNTSVDLMLGIPYQTKADIKEYIDTLSKFDIKHISTYMLSIEPGTPIETMIRMNTIKISDDDEKVELFDYASELLKDKGFCRYEVSNFAKPGFESIHNTRYWRCEDYLGLGLSAHSLIGKYRFYNPDNFDAYYSALNNNKYAYKLEQELEPQDFVGEFIILNLRTSSGINISEFNRRFNLDFVKKYKNAIDINKQYLNISGDSISIKEEYLNVMNSIVMEFIS